MNENCRMMVILFPMMFTKRNFSRKDLYECRTIIHVVRRRLDETQVLSNDSASTLKLSRP